MASRRKDSADSDPLLIDRGAAAEVPTDVEIRAWARDKRVFISSVMQELPDERRAAAEAVRATGARPVLFEEFGGRDADPEDAYLGELETCDVYVGILGRLYGRPLRTRYSATHTEYRHAEQRGLRIAVWTGPSSDREGPQQSFLDEVRTFHVVPAYASADDLRRQIEDRLRSIAAEDLAPWVKLGDVIFRANEVVQDGDRVDIEAKVRADEVVHALEELAPDSYVRGESLRLTWSGRSRDVRVKQVSVKVTAARSKTVKMTLETSEPRSNSLMEMSVNGMTPDDLTEAALRTCLFNEKNPLSRQHMDFLAEMDDPFERLRAARVPDEILRPLAELMLVEELVGSGRASRVHDFRLGASVAGSRQLEFSWDPPKRYSNEKRARRTISGRVTL